MRRALFVFAVDDEGRVVDHTLCSARVVEEIAEEMRDLLRGGRR